MADKKKSSETMRIDLIPDSPSGKKTVKSASTSPLTRMNWAPRKTPAYVARSRYQELLNSVYDAALITRLSGEIVDCNTRAVEFLRYERSALLEKAVFEIIAGSDESLMATLCQNLENERYTLIQAYCLRSDNTSFPAEVAVNKLRLDELCLCFFMRDITLRMRTEERLLLEHNALQIAGNGVVIADLQARAVYVNPAFVSMLGYEETEELTNKDTRELFADAGSAEELVTQVLADDQTWMSEMEMKRRDGREIYAQVSATCNRTADNAPTGIVFSFADITIHKKAEDELHDAQSKLEKEVDRQASELALAKGKKTGQ